MALNLFNLLAVKVIAEQQSKQVEPGLLVAAAVLPGVAGIAVPVLALQKTPPARGGRPLRTFTTVPNVVGGLSLDEAKKAITSNKLTPSTVEAYHETVKKDQIFHQGPKADENVPVGTVVEIFVSRGPAPSSSGESDETMSERIADIDIKVTDIQQKLTKPTPEKQGR